MFDQVHGFLKGHPDLAPIFRDSRLSIRQFDFRSGGGEGFAHVFGLKLPFLKSARKRLEKRIQAAVDGQFQGAFRTELVSDGRDAVLAVSYHEGKARELADALKQRHAELLSIIEAMATHPRK